MPRLTKDDCNIINDFFPDLNCSENRQKVWGTLRVEASYNASLNQISLSNEYEHFIEDDYEIELDFCREEFINKVPILFERSNIIRSFAESTAMPPSDLHIYEDDSCCLGVFPEYLWRGALTFIQRKVVPYFYWQSHLRIHGFEPWKALSHGNLGIIEACYDWKNNVKFANKGNNRNKDCFCGSGKKTKFCCGGTL